VPTDADLLGHAYEYLMRHFATKSGKSKGKFYAPSEVSRIIARILGIRQAAANAQTTVSDPLVFDAGMDQREFLWRDRLQELVILVDDLHPQLVPGVGVDPRQQDAEGHGPIGFDGTQTIEWKYRHGDSG